MDGVLRMCVGGWRKREIYRVIEQVYNKLNSWALLILIVDCKRLVYMNVGVKRNKKFNFTTGQLVQHPSAVVISSYIIVLLCVTSGLLLIVTLPHNHTLYVHG